MGMIGCYFASVINIRCKSQILCIIIKMNKTKQNRFFWNKKNKAASWHATKRGRALPQKPFRISRKSLQCFWGFLKVSLRKVTSRFFFVKLLTTEKILLSVMVAALTENQRVQFYCLFFIEVFKNDMIMKLL